jgi:hypothetical protein
MAFVTNSAPLSQSENKINRAIPRFARVAMTPNFDSNMPTKKQPSRTEREIAAKKNHPIAKSNRPARAQNAEAEPPPRKDQNRL